MAEPREGRFVSMLEWGIFEHRRTVIVVFLIMTVVMAWFATQLRIDAGFTKQLPKDHPYMETFLEYRDEFGGANRILIAIMTRQGDIFTPEFFDTLKQATDEVFFLPGVNRSSVTSLFTPNVRFTEVVVGGIAGGNVVPADFEPTEEGLREVRRNILKAGIVGRLVASDFTGALISAELLEFDPDTGEPLDYAAVARQLEEKIRGPFSSHQGEQYDIHIIGFAKMVGDITEGAGRVVMFFFIAFVVTALLILVYASSWRITGLILACSLLAVVWQLGLLPLLGFGLDPMSILVPFLVFAIAVSHAMQMVSAARAEIYLGSDFEEAARKAFRRLLLPGTVALASDTIGFIAILLIDIGIIREMAITASLGVAMIILTNLFLLPVLLTRLKFHDEYRSRLEKRARAFGMLWRFLARTTTTRGSVLVLVLAAGLLAVGLWRGTDVAIGDLHAGVPELRPDSRYNQDTIAITAQFEIGVDVMSVYAETEPQGCIDYGVMRAIDDFSWWMENVEGVHATMALPKAAKSINSGWNEGSLKWYVLPRNQAAMVQATSPVDTNSGLLNGDCSVMPVLLYTTDHKATTIDRIVEEVKRYEAGNGQDSPRFRLAGSIVGVWAATNEAVEAAQFPILFYVFAAIIILCLVSFRSVAGTLCIVLPLGLVSLLAYALMNTLEIGLKVNTLPVVALGVGIGVDYGIYIFSRFQSLLKEGATLTEGFFTTLAISGFGVIFTGCALAIGVATWIFSPLQFQADMGVLLTFMFIMNMLGAILLLPALAAWLLRGYRGDNAATPSKS
ncbi:MAG: MMPL family transporter [Gammaproteobacteria bacterium]|nr:MMPL family transporter [Gammaproteobacteria bacterium]